MGETKIRSCGGCVRFRPVGGGRGLCAEPVRAVRWAGRVRDSHVLVSEHTDAGRCMLYKDAAAERDRELERELNRADALARVADPVTCAEASGRYGVSVSALNRWCREGAISGAVRAGMPSGAHGGRTPWVMPRAELESALRERGRL